MELARRVEGNGYSTLTMPDHFDDQLAPVPALTAAAAVTDTLRVGALVWDNDYKHPLVLAKELATMDVLSNGRVEIGLGAGWMIADYEQSGMPYDRAGVPEGNAVDANIEEASESQSKKKREDHAYNHLKNPASDLFILRVILNL